MTRKHPQVPTVRTRLGSCDRRPRRWVRPLVCSATFPLARSLPSTCSAGPMGRPLCEGFLGTLKRSDSLHPCITVVPRGCTVRTWQDLTRPEAGPPGFRTPCFRACQRSPTPPGAGTPCRSGALAVAFHVCGARRHPGGARWRGSLLCLHVPLSTLRAYRYRESRMTRGQCGWLTLHCQGLAPFNTLPACPGADPNARGEPPPTVGARHERTLLAVGSSAKLDSPGVLVQNLRSVIDCCFFTSSLPLSAYCCTFPSYPDSAGCTPVSFARHDASPQAYCGDTVDIVRLVSWSGCR